jgi:tripartite-type tricarboxylate transporter receptor subunit TctC
MKEFRDQMAKIGGEVMETLSPARFDDFIRTEIERNRGIAKAAGIQAK